MCTHCFYRLQWCYGVLSMTIAQEHVQAVWLIQVTMLLTWLSTCTGMAAFYGRSSRAVQSKEAILELPGDLRANSHVSPFVSLLSYL